MRDRALSKSATSLEGPLRPPRNFDPFGKAAAGFQVQARAQPLPRRARPVPPPMPGLCSDRWPSARPSTSRRLSPRLEERRSGRDAKWHSGRGVSSTPRAPETVDVRLSHERYRTIGQDIMASWADAKFPSSSTVARHFDTEARGQSFEQWAVPVWSEMPHHSATAKQYCPSAVAGHSNQMFARSRVGRSIARRLVEKGVQRPN